MRGQGIQHAQNGGQSPPDHEAQRRGPDRVSGAEQPTGAGRRRSGWRRLSRGNRSGWLSAGQRFVGASVVLVIAMQAVEGQWFPPPVSVSQYGIGPWGWIFSAWAVAVALGPVCLERAVAPALSAHTRLARWLLTAGAAGSLVMAVVRTQAGGAQQTWNAKVHMVGSIAALAFLPLGILAVLWVIGGRWRVWATILVGLIAGSLTLLLFAAFGVDTAGLGAPRSWAFWQAIAVVLCEALPIVMAWATRWLAAGARAP